MISKVFNIIFIVCAAITCSAQYKLSGIVRSQNDSTILKDFVVFLDSDSKSTATDMSGKFVFNNLPAGDHTLHFMGEGFRYHKQSIRIVNADVHIVVTLEEQNETLEEVVISDLKSSFSLTKMRSIESVGIYEAKKSEVIIPDQLVANIAANNARQVYARVAGLNIWENDGAGLQLSIGGRGLDPNRTSNFNTRQNGYDISADALGYPESYYTPPVEAIERIQIVRGAASLQYGTQFGGLINFVMRKPVDEKLELTVRQTGGSFGFYNAFTSASGTVGKVSYYTFFQYKQGKGWRENSEFDNRTVYANVNYQITDRTKVGIDLTQMSYLAQQAGGLTDLMFKENPRQSNRERNWFKVNWNLIAIHFDHQFSDASDLNVRVFGLSANRYSIGFRPNRVASFDDNSERDLIKGEFENWGAEARYLKHYTIENVQSATLVGGRYYHGFNHSTQGLGSTGKDANFSFVNDGEFVTYDYRFPNRNASVFTENVFYISDKFSVTPGIRFEHISTTADGYYGNIFKDLAGNVINITREQENRISERQFVLAGLGVSYRPISSIDLYANLSQNYRSITFNDMRISNPSATVDQNLEDERGYSFDLGVRSDETELYNFDVSLFYLNYNNRIGEINLYDEHDRVIRQRGNMGQAIIQGLEAYGEANFLRLLYPDIKNWSGIVFNNIALIHSNYKASKIPGVANNTVEFVPAVNIKSGMQVGYKDLKVAFQYTHLSRQFTDASNAESDEVSSIIGIIPAYSIMDLSLNYTYKKFKVETSINNLANRMYFTRRATGYPGPGIIPSDGRSFFVTLQVKI